MIILYFLIAIIPVVVIHELGHFYIGKWMGIKPQVFSVGFGPELWNKKAKDGTIWRIAALPLGGYVKFHDDQNGTGFPNLDSSNPPYEAKYIAKLMTLLAGPFANFLLSIFLFFCFAFWNGFESDAPIFERSFIESDLQKGDIIKSLNGENLSSRTEFYQIAGAIKDRSELTALIERDGETKEVTIPHPFLAVISWLDPKLPAFKAGLEINDQIVRANDIEISTLPQLSEIIQKGEGAPLRVNVLRGDEEVMAIVQPEAFPLENGGERWVIGIDSRIFAFDSEPASFSESVSFAFRATTWILTMSAQGIKDLIVGDVGVEALSGPVGIASAAEDAAQNGFWLFVQFVALVSSAIGFLNLLPIPILDGGHVVMVTYEKITGKLPPQRFLNLIFSLGIGLLFGLMIVSTINDLT